MKYFTKVTVLKDVSLLKWLSYYFPPSAKNKYWLTPMANNLSSNMIQRTWEWKLQYTAVLEYLKTFWYQWLFNPWTCSTVYQWSLGLVCLIMHCFTEGHANVWPHLMFLHTSKHGFLYVKLKYLMWSCQSYQKGTDLAGTTSPSVSPSFSV